MLILSLILVTKDHTFVLQWAHIFCVYMGVRMVQVGSCVRMLHCSCKCLCSCACIVLSSSLRLLPVILAIGASCSCQAFILPHQPCLPVATARPPAAPVRLVVNQATLDPVVYRVRRHQQRRSLPTRQLRQTNIHNKGKGNNNRCHFRPCKRSSRSNNNMVSKWVGHTNSKCLPLQPSILEVISSNHRQCKMGFKMGRRSIRLPINSRLV